MLSAQSANFLVEKGVRKMADELRLKTSAADYAQKMAVLQQKMSELETIYGEYNRLKMQANRVVGDGDSNTEQLRAAIDKNMEAIGKQHAALKENWEMLNKQNEQLGITSTQVSELLKAAAETIGAAANTFKTLSDM